MILIIDNGSQYTHLIKRNCRDLGYQSVVLNARAGQEELDAILAKGVERIILSGGPSSAYLDPPNLSSLICTRARSSELSIPLLGICYGQQMIAHIWGAKVGKGKSAEYGTGRISVDDEDEILKGMAKEFTAWVSHFDEVKDVPEGFKALAHSDSCGIEAMRHTERKIFGVQFHPEVWHTENGERILKNFLEL